jgi:hypothetical protein
MDDLGVRSVCTYRNLFMVFSGIGTIPRRPDDPRHIAYIRGKLAASGALWNICSWHKNQRAMQLGKKKDAVGWAAYEACREAGAIIATGHEHSYSRTHLLSHFENRTILSTSPILRIGRGRTFAFVSGLGGKSIRQQRRDGPGGRLNTVRIKAPAMALCSASSAMAGDQTGPVAISRASTAPSPTAF